MANIIIGIHGLGNKPPVARLKKWWKLSMTEGLRTLGSDNDLPEFEMAYWSDILYEKPLDPNEKDPGNPLYIDEKYLEASENFVVEDHSIRKKIVDYLGRQMNRIFLNEDLSLNYSFVSDTIMRRYFSDLEQYYYGNKTDHDVHYVRDLIRNRLSEKIRRHRKDNIMLIGHSMGSIIAFDVLTFLVPDIKINTFITMGSPLGLPFILSKIAAEEKEKGINTPMLQTPPGVTNKWFNFSDILDKVAFNYKIEDYYSDNSFGVKPIDLLVVNNYRINGIPNPHKSFGYLRTPEFSKILNQFIQEGKEPERPKLIKKLLDPVKNLLRR